MDLLRPFRNLNAQLSPRVEPQPEQRAGQVTPWGPWDNSYQINSSGVLVNETTALNLMTVFGCVSLICDTIATLPRKIYRDLGEDSSEEVTVKPRWFENPNPNTDMVEFTTQSLMSLLLDGSLFWTWAQDLNRTPTEIYVLDPTKVVVKERPRRREDVPGTSGAVVEHYVNGELFRGNLMHIKGMTRPGQLRGMSPVEYARQTIGWSLATQQFGSSFFANGILPSGALETEADLTRDQATKLAQEVSKKHGGVGQHHLPLILDNGAHWTPLSVTPEQAQFLATLEHQSAQICAQMFLVDPSMLGIAINRGQNLTYANLADRGTHLVQYTLMRWLIRLERAFTLLLPKPQYMKFNVDGIQRADLAARTTSYRTALGSNVPWMTVNEVRDLEEMPPIAGNDSLPEPATPAPTSLAPFPNGNGKQPATVGADSEPN